MAIWTRDLEKMKDFYLEFFALSPGEKYYNPTKQFSSYFLSFDNGPRIELMHRPDIAESLAGDDQLIGLAHFAISVGSREAVDSLTEKIRNKGHRVLGEPRTTGDGYYESIISDPEGNWIEITI